MIYADLHMHSIFSEDSQTPMEEQIQTAISKGLKQICFTEHMDMDYPENEAGETFECNTDAYYEHYLKVRDEYKDRLEIFFGIEYGFQNHLKGRCHKYINSYPFDLVIGSTHVVDGRDPYYKEFYEGRSEREAYLSYFESELESVRIFDDFDIYGHLDYVVRYGPDRDKYYSYEAYSEILDEILKKLIEKGKGIEINTGGLRKGLKSTNPCLEVIKRYRELGGEIITAGADAHTPEAVAYAFDAASQILEAAGFSYYAVFKNRKPVFYPL
ncbi:MAG: histidinol-phosphatase HisJ family protein [Lachnospiraceae bacterium]|nr:histidinol-phosphatase HisJ family protein [Lachnospiraceae bacterium]